MEEPEDAELIPHRFMSGNWKDSTVFEVGTSQQITF